MDRVLEIGGHAAGYCGRLFVRAGADVVRLDDGLAEPAWASSQAMDLFLHAGKRRIASADIDLIGHLAARADVVVCAARCADDLERLRFDEWGAPVKVAITPYGRTGPKRNWQATPNVILAAGGYTNLVGDADKAPLTVPGHYLEFQTGALAYAGANANRFAGQINSLDLSMLESLMSLSQFTTVRWHCAGEERSRHGNDFWFVVPSELFRCADGWIYVNVVPAFWDAFTVFVERPDLLLDPRFENNDLRMQNRDALHEIIAEVLCNVPKAELVERAEQCRVPAGVVMDFDEVLQDPHLHARSFWETVGDSAAEHLVAPGLPYMLTGEARPSLSAQQSVAAGAVQW